MTGYVTVAEDYLMVLRAGSQTPPVLARYPVAMGNALVMMTIPEEALGYTPLCVRGKDGKPFEIEKKRGIWVEGKARKDLLREHPDAFFMMPVPYRAVWFPPEEPWKKKGLDWHWDPKLLAGHRAAVQRSFEKFLNGKLERLDRMVRTGWWILEQVRVRVSSLTEVPHAEGERPHGERKKVNRTTSR